MSERQHHPDPANAPRRPGLRPHVYEPNHLWTLIFRQGRLWIDYYGNEHEIALMDPSYVEKVIVFCRRQAWRIQLLVTLDDLAALKRLHDPDKVAAARAHAVVAAALSDDAEAWLEEAPLLRALRDRLAQRPS